RSVAAPSAALFQVFASIGPLPSGDAGPDGRALTATTPVRIASVTKTFVAATVLRLHERGEIGLDAPIGPLLDPELEGLLSADGYDTGAITVRHLLMHVGGLPDHADGSFGEIVGADPQQAWSRRDQVALLIEEHEPLGPPGVSFHYSDTGYVLLGDIVERLAEAPLASIVRKEMQFDRIGLRETWWESVETPPAGAAPRAHQHLDGADIYDWSPTIDLYGGGGLVSSPRDLARFYAALFGGEILERPETLDLMTTAPGHPEPGEYRIGLFPGNAHGVEIFAHGGFWGLWAAYAPEHEIAAAGVVLDQAGYRALRDLLKDEIASEAASDR
ncbi:MAG: serine hydrolase domain-containing protein, partial [Pseudomonadota bacterium]